MHDLAPARPRRRLLVTDRQHTPAGTLSLALVAGAALGLLAWWLQDALPTPWGTLANTSALWGLAGFAAAALQRARGVLAIAAGALALIGMVMVFAVFDDATPNQWVAYLLVGGVAGAVFGLAGSLARSGRTSDQLTAAVITGGVVAGEGLYGITVVAASGPQWWAELALGLALAVAIPRTLGARMAAFGMAAVTALLLLSAFSAYDAAA